MLCDEEDRKIGPKVGKPQPVWLLPRRLLRARTYRKRSLSDLSESPLRVVLCWHMHQPQYRDLVSGQYRMPWTYLHAIKDYADMAAILESIPEGRAVVNFAPVLLDQINDYADQIRAFLVDSRALRDPLLDALSTPVLPADPDRRLSLIRQCLRANEKRLIERFEPYRRLADLARTLTDKVGSLRYINEDFLGDLLSWYHLAWLGETVRREDDRVKRLLKKEAGYSLHDRRELLSIIGEILSGLIPRYRALSERGQVELSMSPYDHPIMPLMIDLHSGRDADDSLKLPMLPAYPGGEERVRWHIERGQEAFRRYFGSRPRGCWPSEGGVSEPVLRILAEHGFEWVASGEAVMHNSLRRSSMGAERCHHHPFRLNGISLSCFFRDDNLSDLIGFSYSDWQSDDAVNNLIHHLESIAAACKDQNNQVASIIMDGENAWEHYPFNAYYFLATLYERLSSHPSLQLTTFAECVDAGLDGGPLNTLVAGSWVYGTFSTWIGSPDKNRGWELLAEAKQHFDAAVADGRLTGPRLEAATRQLGVCEGSDWYWWLGDYNPAESVSEFESLFRSHLANLYTLIGDEPPHALTQPLSHGSGAPEQGGTMRRSHDSP